VRCGSFEQRETLLYCRRNVFFDRRALFFALRRTREAGDIPISPIVETSREQFLSMIHVTVHCGRVELFRTCSMQKSYLTCTASDFLTLFIFH
jgi:hypothetical protein